jgi:integrase
MSFRLKSIFHLDNKILQVRSSNGFVTKTNTSERDIPMSGKLYELLKQLSESSTNEYVFTFKDKQVKERRMLAFCKTVAKKAEIKKNATLHKFRHSFNSHLAQLGVDYSVREYLMGHKPKSMTDHYTKIDPKKLHKEVSLLDKLIP